MSERPVTRSPRSPRSAPTAVVRRRPVQPVAGGGERPEAAALALSAPDGPPMVVAGLRLMLEGYADRVRLRASATDADVVLVDAAHRCGPVRLPTGEAPVVVLVREGDLAAVRDARAAGASPVPVTATPTALVGAIESAHRRRGPHERALRSVPAATSTREEPVHPLSSREEQVLNGVCAGLSNEDIAAELYVSINSVKTYIRSAYRKMGVSRRGQAVVWGMQRGYGDPASGPTREDDVGR